MRKNRYIKRLLVLGAAMLMSCIVSQAQFYEIANQLPQLISPALSGNATYRGVVELSGTAGVGDNRTNFVGISTSQGFQYSTWFFMGVGAGIDVATSNGPGDMLINDNVYYPTNTTNTKAMLPLFSDFRFNIGSQDKLSAFIDLKIGAAWFLGDDYLALGGDGYALMGNGAQFYLKPQLGVRIPISSSKPKQAVNIGLTYQLITSNNNWNWYDNGVSLSSLGLTLGFEW